MKIDKEIEEKGKQKRVNMKRSNLDNNNNNSSRKLPSHQPTRLSRLERLLCTCSCAVGKNEVSFSMAIRNVELMQESLP